ncbi:hypothetical protein [Pseudoalteromonas sp.]|uniref:hypothetical protein n=1 Tax=Pseudoalteromonas sp. TaxID=53249 RepID=UPI002625E21F|nr:hypothetical protein [Pseudoalteromonas sp.]MCP4585356.1 hypothetical protein [Pseudoalteromonas sp.]
MKRKELVKWLEEHYEPDDYILFSYWTKHDMHYINKICKNKQITDHEAEELLNIIALENDVDKFIVSDELKSILNEYSDREFYLEDKNGNFIE